MKLFTLFILFTSVKSYYNYITTDQIINGFIKRSFTYLPTETTIDCNSLKIVDTKGVQIVSSRTNNVCIGNEDGKDFLKNYNL